LLTKSAISAYFHGGQKSNTLASDNIRLKEAPGMKPSAQPKPVLNPEDMNAAFAEACNSGSIERLLALYEPDAVLIQPDGNLLRGTGQIRIELENLLRQNGRMESRNVFCIRFENIALLRGHFVFRAEGPDGRPAQMECCTSEIVRQQPDGTWCYIVDHPFGGGQP
jgi:ketosteroid isomerase-like protein